ncbi:unnamed protein product [Peniophora sp. CBMAI 1063]|nr:unnamed protein product [Peniophora sp. CBMAI 1063]
MNSSLKAHDAAFSAFILIYTAAADDDRCCARLLPAPRRSTPHPATDDRSSAPARSLSILFYILSGLVLTIRCAFSPLAGIFIPTCTASLCSNSRTPTATTLPALASSAMGNTKKPCSNADALVPDLCSLPINTKCPHHLCCPCCVAKCLKDPDGTLCQQPTHKTRRNEAIRLRLQKTAVARRTDAVANAALGDDTQSADLTSIPVVPRPPLPSLSDLARPPTTTGAAASGSSTGSPLDAAWHVAPAGSAIAAEFDRHDAQPRAHTARRELFVATKDAAQSRSVSGKIWQMPSERPKNIMLSVDEATGLFFPSHCPPLLACLGGKDVFDYYDPSCEPEPDWVMVSTSRPLNLSSKMGMILFRTSQAPSTNKPDSEYNNFSTLVPFALSRASASTLSKRPTEFVSQSPAKRRASAVTPEAISMPRTPSVSEPPFRPSPLHQLAGQHANVLDLDVEMKSPEHLNVMPANAEIRGAPPVAASLSPVYDSPSQRADRAPYMSAIPEASGVLLPPVTADSEPLEDFPSDYLLVDILDSTALYCMLRSACDLKVKPAGELAFPYYNIGVTKGGAMRDLLKKLERSTPALCDEFRKLGRDKVATFRAFNTCRKLLPHGTTSPLPWPRDKKDADQHFTYTAPPPHVAPGYKYRRALGTYVRKISAEPPSLSSMVSSPALSTPASPAPSSPASPASSLPASPQASIIPVVDLQSNVTGHCAIPDEDEFAASSSGLSSHTDTTLLVSGRVAASMTPLDQALQGLLMQPDNGPPGTSGLGFNQPDVMDWSDTGLWGEAASTADMAGGLSLPQSSSSGDAAFSFANFNTISYDTTAHNGHDDTWTAEPSLPATNFTNQLPFDYSSHTSYDFTLY